MPRFSRGGIGTNWETGKFPKWAYIIKGFENLGDMAGFGRRPRAVARFFGRLFGSASSNSLIWKLRNVVWFKGVGKVIGEFCRIRRLDFGTKSETLRLGSKGLWRVLASFWNRSKLTKRG